MIGNSINNNYLGTWCHIQFSQHSVLTWASLVAQAVKNLPAMQETQERSPGAGKGNPLQDSYLENSMDRKAGQATVYGITKSSAPLKDYHFILDRQGN